jgi:hypothetical protein
MTTKDEALRLALEALELSSITVDNFTVQAKCHDAITAIKQAQEPVEPVAWFAFADSNGPVPLELYGWDEKACKHAVLTYARADNWKGTVEGYLYQQGWTIKPVYAHPAPTQAEPSWHPIETAPKVGVILLAVIDSAGGRRTFCAEASFTDGELKWQITTGWVGWTRLHSAWTPTHWMPTPPEAK